MYHVGEAIIPVSNVYLNGEEVGCIGYISNSGAILNFKNHNI